MLEIRGKIDANDLELVQNSLKDKSIEIVCAQPCPIQWFGNGAYDGHINPHVSQFLLNNGKKLAVFHVKPIYYLHTNGQWRPMSEIAYSFGNSYIDLKEDWDTKLDLRYLKWMLDRTEILKGNVTIPSPFKVTVNKLPIKLGQEIYLTSADFFPEPNPETTTCDGGACRDRESSWANAHDTADGDAAEDTQTYLCYCGDDFLGTVSRTWNSTYHIGRSFTYFLTGTTIGATDTINSAKFYLKKYGGDGYTGSYITVVQVQGDDIASNTGVAVGDFDECGDALDNPTEGCDSGERILYASGAGWSDGTYDYFELNSTGIGWIARDEEQKPAGATKEITFLGIRDNWDCTDTAPTAYLNSVLWIYSADTADTTSDPKLVVEYGAGVVTNCALPLFFY